MFVDCLDPDVSSVVEVLQDENSECDNEYDHCSDTEEKETNFEDSAYDEDHDGNLSLKVSSENQASIVSSGAEKTRCSSKKIESKNRIKEKFDEIIKRSRAHTTTAHNLHSNKGHKTEKLRVTRVYYSVIDLSVNFYVFCG